MALLAWRQRLFDSKSTTGRRINYLLTTMFSCVFCAMLQSGLAFSFTALPGPGRPMAGRRCSTMNNRNNNHRLSKSGASALFKLNAKPSNSLKPAAIPLMDSGKAMARSGELLIDWTTSVDLYGGAWSAAGAQIRNAGDSVAQAAASCRFKTGAELVCDELREAGTCLSEGAIKLNLAKEEALQDDMKSLAQQAELAKGIVESCGIHLEAAGAGIMQRSGLELVGARLSQAGEDLDELSSLFATLEVASSDGDDGNSDDDESSPSQISGQRMRYASEQMVLAGNNLQGVVPEPTVGKSWLKGGM